MNEMTQRELGVLTAQVQDIHRRLDDGGVRMNKIAGKLDDLRELIREQHASCAKQRDLRVISSEIMALRQRTDRWRTGFKVVAAIGVFSMALVNKEKVAKAFSWLIS
ncbi:MAG: hypothetical protein HOL85_14245 [Rhodospirillaceae bacterium]|jgi:hypothetical protein|nr:hypothetical protein [Rhodospirillaceae bacterium]